MAAVINTNIASLNAQRNLSTSQTALATSLQRLSTGMRINSAKDDAAGLAISERFTTQIRGLNQAVRNANDGISLAQTGEGALSEVTNNLQRIRELAVQAANATNSASDRAALNLEVQQRLAEIDRTTSQTSFNGQKILDGSLGSASFQVGANAGETIGISLNSSMRATDIGGIASTVSDVLGATAVAGHIDVTSTNLNYGTAGSAATAGQIDLTFNTSNFAASVSYVAGTSTPQAVDNTGATTDFSQAATAATAKVTTSAAFTAGDYSASGANAHFEFTDDTVTGLVIALDGTNYTGDEAGMITEINAQLTAAGSNTVASYAGGSVVFTSGETGTGATQPSIANVGADLNGDGLNTFVNTGGAAAIATGNASLTIDGETITLNQNNADATDVASELTTKMQASALGAGYSAAVVSGNIVITNATGGTNTTAVAISNVDANAAAAGFANSAGVAGTAASAGNPANLTIGGTAVSLNSNYGSYDALASAIGATLGGSYSVTNNAGTLTIARTSTGVASTAVDVTAADANADTAITNMAGATKAGTAGADPVATTNATFYVDGTAVTLDQDYADQDAVAADIQSQLTGYTAANDAGTITIAKTGSQAAVNITGADTNATAGGFGYASGVAGTASGSVAVTDFTVNGTTIAAGTYATAQALADNINVNVSGVYATVSGGALTLSSAAAITLGGANATGSLGFDSTTAAADQGSLNDIDVTTVANANSTLQRIDSALGSVSDLRSTFGAIQNRFDSVIASLSSTSENLTASRSRIQDADFAAETAALTRGQILQQAGVAMLSQANALPQTVLSLLR